MSEEVKNIRLNKVAKEFNVGVTRLVEFLAKKGIHIESNPNTKISGDIYELLAKAFQSERAVKENADKIEIATPVKDSVVIEAAPIAVQPNENSKNFEESDNDEVFIKDYVEVASSKTDSDKDENVSRLVAEQKEPEFEPQVIQASVPSNSSDGDAFTAQLRIVNKIDLNSINAKSRPDKKTKEEREQERTEKKAQKEAEKKKAQKQRKEEKRKAEKTLKDKQKQENSTVVDAKEVVQKAEPIQPMVNTIVEKEPEFIETQYTKLEGPKIVSKIDISQFDKPKQKLSVDAKGKSDDVTDDDKKKKKRKRLKKEYKINLNRLIRKKKIKPRKIRRTKLKSL